MSTLLLYLLPVLYVLFLWWFSTGAILWLNRRSERVRRWSLGVATLAALGGFAALYFGREDTSLGGAYHAFTAALVIWGWIEMSFVMGVVTGPRTTPCPPQSRGWTRFWHAFQAIAYHELALVACLGLVAALSDGASNQVGFWTFAVLWLMRLSAKLNVFLGVPNFTDEFLPERLRYLETYFRVRSLNALFPLSITLATGTAVWLGLAAAAAGSAPFEASALTFLTTLLTLAILEHWFMVLPLRDAALWQWALGDNLTETAETRGQQVVDTRFERVRPASVPGSP